MDRLAVKLNAARLDRHQTHQALEQSGFPHPVAAQHHSYFALGCAQAYVPQNVRTAIELVDIVDA